MKSHLCSSCYNVITTVNEASSYHKLTSLLSSFQECDQVHIDDVSSDDNGQDLR